MPTGRLAVQPPRSYGVRRPTYAVAIQLARA